MSCQPAHFSPKIVRDGSQTRIAAGIIAKYPGVAPQSCTNCYWTTIWGKPHGAESSAAAPSLQWCSRYNLISVMNIKNGEFLARHRQSGRHHFVMHAPDRQQLRQLLPKLLACLFVTIVCTAAQGEPPDRSTNRRQLPSDNDYSKVSVFGVEGTGNKFVYLFDRSSSMDGAPLAAAKRRLTESIQIIDEVQQFHIIFFNQRLLSLNVTGGPQRIAFATDQNKKLAARFIRGVKADGGTNRFAALKHALAIKPDVIFFLSDADDPMSAKEMSEIARLNERGGAQLCAIEFGRGDSVPKSNFLQELARENDGQYAYVNVEKLPK
jgi:hypothetical protein